ncbi:MAG: DUF5367 family protein [Chloroflexi bacterium]|nr:DUF5367 family protein [Chloroflexota bacterium]MCY4246343.1 DUF5367 family protein [Chloroflexota bacterium]
MDRKLFLFYGLVGWPIATLLHRLVGQVYFRADVPLILALLWIGMTLFMIVITVGVFRWKALSRSERYEAVVLFCAPAMALDALVVEFYELLFPNMPAAAGNSYGAWILITYATCLLCAFLPVRQDAPDPQARV